MVQRAAGERGSDFDVDKVSRQFLALGREADGEGSVARFSVLFRELSVAGVFADHFELKQTVQRVMFFAAIEGDLVLLLRDEASLEFCAVLAVEHEFLFNDLGFDEPFRRGDFDLTNLSEAAEFRDRDRGRDGCRVGRLGAQFGQGGFGQRMRFLSWGSAAGDLSA